MSISPGSGTCDRIDFSANGDSRKIIKVNNGVKSDGAQWLVLTVNAQILSYRNVSKVTTMEAMFKGTSYFK